VMRSSFSGPFCVNRRRYRAHTAFPYVRHARKIDPSMSLPTRPRIRIRLVNGKTGRMQIVTMLVDTGAEDTMLTEASARALGIDLKPSGPRDIRPVFMLDGTFVIALFRKVAIDLGGGPHQIDVGVPFQKRSKRRDVPLTPVTTLDILGRDGIADQYLLCLDNDQLYAFPPRQQPAGPLRRRRAGQPQ